MGLISRVSSRTYRKITNMRRSNNPYSKSSAQMKKEAPAEAISKVVANLPAEQMFELMKEMKECLANNPVEARNMLLQNPQLTYALLQAQVVMSIVDPEIVVKNLYLNQIDKNQNQTRNQIHQNTQGSSLSRR